MKVDFYFTKKEEQIPLGKFSQFIQMFVIVFLLILTSLVPNLVQANKTKRIKQKVKKWEKLVITENCNKTCIKGLGVFYLSQNKIKKTYTVFKKLSLDNPLEPLVWYYLGYAARKLKKFKNALKAFTTYKSLNSKDFEVHYSLGKCYLELGDLPQAKIHLQKFLKSLKPRQKYWKQKTTDLLKLIQKKLSPVVTVAKPKKPTFYLSKALGAYKQKNFSQAVHYLLQGVKFHPSKIMLWRGLATLTTETGLCAKALPSLLRGVNLHPNQQSLVLTTATCLEKQNKFSKALSLYKIFHKNQPHVAVIIYNIAVLSQRSGKKIQALHFYKLFLQKVSSTQLKNRQKAAQAQIKLLSGSKIKNQKPIKPKQNNSLPKKKITKKPNKQKVLKKIYSDLKNYKFAQANQKITQALKKSKASCRLLALKAEIALTQLKIPHAKKFLNQSSNLGKCSTLLRIKGKLMLKLRLNNKAIKYFEQFISKAASDPFEKTFIGPIHRLIRVLEE